MEELKKITTGVDVKAIPRMSLIEQLILFVNMRQGPTETNDEYLDRFNTPLQNLIIAGGQHILRSLETMGKSGVTATPEEITIEEENIYGYIRSNRYTRRNKY